MPHTNTATLWMAASELLMLAGRMHEYDVWDGNDKHKRDMIIGHMRDQAKRINEWIACNPPSWAMSAPEPMTATDIGEAA